MQLKKIALAGLWCFSFLSMVSAAEVGQNKRQEEHKIYSVLPKDKFADQKQKNGITLDQALKDFDNEFKFVSAHYREDKFEIRLIYGNRLAMEGLKSKKLQYKDGSIFYKAVYQTEHDPNFNASLVPETQPIVRQIMLYDAKKFKKTNGWGYAVFTERGETLPGDPDATLETCYACHKLVESRNNIFSVPMESITPNNKIPSPHYTQAGLVQSKKLSEKLFKFKISEFSKLDPDIKSMIDHKTKQVNLLDGDIIKMDFSGFMTELSSFLINETKKNGLPSLALRSFNNQLMFTYSFIDTEPGQCKNKNEKLIRFGWGKKADSLEKNSYVVMKKCFVLNK